MEPDQDYIVDLPTARKVLCEAPSADAAFVGRSSSIMALVRNLGCRTSGLLECTRVQLLELGGTIQMSFKCTGCSMTIDYDSSLDDSNLSHALQVCTHSQYERVLKEELGMFAVGGAAFFDTIKNMYPHVKTLLDEVCRLGRQQMQALADTELGSFKCIVTVADCTWLTHGYKI